MVERRLHLHPVEPQPELTSRMPGAHALRWRSAAEDEGGRSAVTVFLTQWSYVRMCAHAGSDLQHEVGGVLAGKWRVDAASGEKFVVIEGVLPAPHTRHGSTYVTFTQDSLVALNEQLEERYPGKKMVGWYHTHPRLGIFLSTYDTWLHEHFFPEPWQVAVVIDPLATEGGVFVRTPEGSLDPQRYFGFCELTDSGRRTVVHWKNLQPEADANGMAGG
jgi:proteasome lid subunit RPN8/RPN11